MLCSHCHKPNDYDANYCVNCGHPFSNKPVVRERDASTGYILVAIMLSLSVLPWAVADWLIDNNQNPDGSLLTTLRIIRSLGIAAMFIIILVYVKTRIYKIICGLAALVVMGYDWYTLSEIFKT